MPKKHIKSHQVWVASALKMSALCGLATHSVVRAGNGSNPCESSFRMGGPTPWISVNRRIAFSQKEQQDLFLRVDSAVHPMPNDPRLPFL